MSLAKRVSLVLGVVIKSLMYVKKRVEKRQKRHFVIPMRMGLVVEK